ncbi:protein translocase subunit SecF [Candidatus Babeliales bacterium]|nr:protein translocase subunit SecF [Candidatus Babeliales bacterium]
MINFLKYRTLAFLLSGAFLAYTITSYFTVGLKYSVDFEGGTQILFSFSQPTTSQDVERILDEAGWPGIVTREFSNKEIMVRVKEFSGDAQGESERVKEALQKAMKDVTITIESKDSVGPAAGESLRQKALYALLLGLLAMLLYIAIRFEFSFAVGAVIALLHDALCILGFFILLGKEISPNIIVAILTILGCSINDTIVIFSRIRENTNKMAGRSLATIVNTSINETLRRTILTSVSTGLALLPILVLGGAVLSDLSMALLVGIIVGTYSSVYIASPVMMLLHKKMA